MEVVQGEPCQTEDKHRKEKNVLSSPTTQDDGIENDVGHKQTPKEPNRYVRKLFGIDKGIERPPSDYGLKMVAQKLIQDIWQQYGCQQIEKKEGYEQSVNLLDDKRTIAVV